MKDKKVKVEPSKKSYNLLKGLFGVASSYKKTATGAIKKSKKEMDDRIERAKRNSGKVEVDDDPVYMDGHKSGSLVRMFLDDGEMGKKNIDATQKARKAGKIRNSPMDLEKNRKFQDPEFVDAWAYKKYKRLPGRRKSKEG